MNIYSKTVRSLRYLNPLGHVPNLDAKIRKQAGMKITTDQINLWKAECRRLTPALAARCIQIPIVISDDILYREPSLLTLQMADLLNEFMVLPMTNT